MPCVLVYSLIGVFPLRFLSSPAKTARYAACYLLLSSLLLLVQDGIPLASKEQLRKGQKCHPLAADSDSSCNLASFPFPSDGACTEAEEVAPNGIESFSSLLSDHLVDIDPPVLKFGQHPIGQHTDRTVKIINHSQKHSLHLVSVSGTSSDFHPSFFRTDRVAPGEHTLFDVYFLPREVGSVESTIHIHTESGLTYPLPVSGQGIQNPYQLRSLSARIPLNSSYSPVISLYNPHSTPLQITEMYSTALDLHLELLSSDASQSAWVVPPYQRKEVMRIHFSADRFDQYTAFIRVKTSFDRETEVRLIIPLEVEVLSPDSLFSSAHELDFGLLRSSDSPTSLPISLYNPSGVALRITSLTLSNHTSFLHLEQDPPSPLMDARTNLSIATLRLSPGEVPADVRFIRGSVHVNGSAVEASKRRSIHFSIPYTARVEHGHLHIPKLVFHSGSLPTRPQTVSVWLSHTFRQPLAVFRASLSYPEAERGETGYLSLHELHWPLMLLPQDRAVALSLKFMPNSPLILAHPTLHIHTNTSDFELPIHIYNQQLLLAEEDELEFAVINPNITKTLSIKMQNLNADVITVRDMIVPITFLSLEKVVMLPLLKHQLISTSDSAVPFVVQPNHEATLTFKLTRPSSGDVSSEVILITDHQRLHIPVHYRSISGSIEAQRIVFQPSFPGHVETKNIVIRNTFTQTVRLLDLRQMDPIDPRIYLLDHHDIDHIELTAFSSTHIAKLTFDPMRGFPDKVFTGGFSDFLTVEWMSSLDLGVSAPEVDKRLYEKMQAVWRECQNEELTKASATFEIDTDVLAGIKVDVEASLQWPSITPDAPIHFPLTLIGNFSTQSVPVMNPSDDPLVVQALLVHFYPDVQAALDIVDDWLDIPSSPFASTSSFHLAEAPSSRALDYTGGPHPTSYLKEFDSSVSDLTWTYILPPKSLVNVTVVFEPRDEMKTYSVILLRNNLTVMDAVVLHGTGAEGKFSLDGKMPESQEALFFNMTNESLAICNKSKGLSQATPSITRTFVARNQGQLDIRIEFLSINGYPCQGYGFSIRQCKPFTLRPQSSLKLDITFTPDFTLYQLSRQLILKTTHGQSLTFHLFASVPAEFIPLCLAVAPKPPWEPYIPFVILPIIMFAIAYTLYLSLHPPKKEAVTPIPGVPSTYSSEGKKKVFKLAAQFSFESGKGEDPLVVKDKLERCEALVKEIKTMNKKNSPIPQTDEEPPFEVVVPPLFLPGHRDLVDIMISSYEPPDNTISHFTHSDLCPDDRTHLDLDKMEVAKRTSYQKTSAFEPINVQEKQLGTIKSVSDSKHDNNLSTASAKSNSKDRADNSAQSRCQSRSRQEEHIAKEVKSCQDANASKEVKSNPKPDLKMTISPSNCNIEADSQNVSPVTSPSVESKKLAFNSQSNRGSKYKKSKLSQRGKVKNRKERCKMDRTSSPKESGVDSENQEADSLLTETDTQQDDREQIETNNALVEKNGNSSNKNEHTKRAAPVTEKELITTPMHTPPKGPLPIRKDSHPKVVHGPGESGNRCGNRQDQTIQRVASNTQQTPALQYTNSKVGGQSSKDVITSLSQRVLPQEESGRNCVSADTKEFMNQQMRMSPVSSNPAELKSDRYKPPKSISYNSNDPEAKYNCATKKENENPIEEAQDSEKRVPFSGMSEELKQRIEEVCAPLTFDAPPLTRETHEQLSSILSTDAEPFIPDDVVLKKLLENSGMFQSEKKPTRKQRQRSGLLDPQALAQLSLLLQNQSQCDDYINLLATSLRMEPRILHQHLQYCWLCYQCNLIGLLGNAPSLDLPELLSQLQQNEAKENPPQAETTGNRFSHHASGGHSAQASYHQTLLSDRARKLSPEPMHACDVTTQKGRAHLSKFNVRNTASETLHHTKLNNTDWSNESNSLGGEKNTYIPCGLQQNQPLGSFSHWNDSKLIPEGKMRQKVRQETVYKDHPSKSHDDSSFFERSVTYENVGQDTLSSSDPWSKEQASNKWKDSATKNDPPSLTEPELLPSRLMNSRPPSPQSLKHPCVPTNRNSSNEQPLLFLGSTIWSSKESVNEEDRLNSWKTITGKVVPEKRTSSQSRNNSYTPMDEKRWNQPQARGRSDKSVF